MKIGAFAVERSVFLRLSGQWLVVIVVGGGAAFKVSVFVFIVKPILIVLHRFVGEIVLPSNRFIDLIVILPLYSVEFVDEIA